MHVAGSSAMYASDFCESPMWQYEGTRNTQVLQQLVFFENDFHGGLMAGKGSTRLEFSSVL